MIGYARDHSVAESFAYLNALQPGVFSLEDIARAVAAKKDGPDPEFDDLPPIDPPIKP
jgi:enoyl-CoA hydratase